MPSPPPTDPTAALRTAAEALVDEWDAAMAGDMPLNGHYQKQALDRLRAALASQADDPSGAYTVRGRSNAQILVDELTADDSSGPDDLDVDRLARAMGSWFREADPDDKDRNR